MNVPVLYCIRKLLSIHHLYDDKIQLEAGRHK